MALVQRWAGVEVDLEVHQVIYSGQNGPLDLIQVTCIRTLVGTMEERDRGITGRATKLIVGALSEVRAGWPNLQ